MACLRACWALVTRPPASPISCWLVGIHAAGRPADPTTHGSCTTSDTRVHRVDNTPRIAGWAGVLLQVLVAVLGVALVVLLLLLSPAKVCCWLHVSRSCITHTEGGALVRRVVMSDKACSQSGKPKTCS
jgi:hypothetical protein